MKDFRQQCTERCKDFDELEAQEINLIHKWAELETYICGCIDAFHFAKFGYKDPNYIFSLEENLIYVAYEKSGVYLKISMEFFEDPELWERIKQHLLIANNTKCRTFQTEFGIKCKKVQGISAGILTALTPLEM